MESNTIKYGLGDKVPLLEAIFYTIQHFALFIASVVVIPIVVGYALGLNQADVSAMLQRTLFLCGLISIIQTAIGHRLPIIDAPAGLWVGFLILMSSNIETFGNDFSILRTNIESGMIVAGVIILILVFSGLIEPVIKLFTPIVNGVLILLMVLQLAPSVIKGMTGISESDGSVDAKSVLVFFVTLFLVLLISSYARGFIRSIATFLGVLLGWIFAILIGVSQTTVISTANFFSFPGLFVWGKPTFDIGIIITCTIASLFLLSMVFASVNGTAEAVEESVSMKSMKRAIGIHGLTTILTGIFSTIGFMPYVSSAGIVRMTNVAARIPFYCAALGIMLLGLITPLSSFFTSLPTAVGYASLCIIFSLIMGLGLREFKKIEIGNRESFIIGISIIIGLGVMFLPEKALSELPQVLEYLLSNGLIVGMILVMILEKIVLKKNI
jgi:xanthine/uracil permease